MANNQKVQENIAYLVLCLHIVDIPRTDLVCPAFHNPGPLRQNRSNNFPDILHVHLSLNNEHS